MIGILYDRYEQTTIRLHCHADVDMTKQFNRIRCKTGVHIGELTQRCRYDLCQQVIIAWSKTPFFSHLGFDALAGRYKFGGVHFH